MDEDGCANTSLYYSLKNYILNMNAYRLVKRLSERNCPDTDS